MGVIQTDSMLFAVNSPFIFSSCVFLLKVAKPIVRKLVFLQSCFRVLPLSSLFHIVLLCKTQQDDVMHKIQLLGQLGDKVLT